VLIDHLPDPQLREIVARTRGRAQVEVSGDISLHEVENLAASGVDFASIGALTQSAACVDMSFELHRVS
jgi:nicotinate-nucleotide pyrophosphorylase (carboxylating)